MWLKSIVISDGLVEDAEVLRAWALSASAGPVDAPRDLLVHVVADEDADHQDVFRSIAIFGLRLDRDRMSGVVDLQSLLFDLTPEEQTTIRTWLINERWPAWARADHAIRRLLGVPEAPVLLAEAARHWKMPLQTLAKAAAEERLPTILAGDRRMVYLATIAEAQAQRRLHYRPGRPLRRSTPAS